MRKLLVASQKSGVGKTTTSMNLAAAAAGARVLLLDADPLNAVGEALDLARHPRRRTLRADGIELPGILCHDVVPGLDVLCPYEDGGCPDDEFDELLRLAGSAAPRGGYGCLVVNAPPFMGGNPGQLLRACDELVLVMRAEPMAHRTLPAFLELVQRSRREGRGVQMRGILLTLPDGESPGGRWERELRGRFGARVLPQVIPFDDGVREALQAGRILSHARPDAPAALQYLALAGALALAGDATEAAEGDETPLQVAAAALEAAGRPVGRPAPALVAAAAAPAVPGEPPARVPAAADIALPPATTADSSGDTVHEPLPPAPPGRRRPGRPTPPRPVPRPRTAPSVADSDNIPDLDELLARQTPPRPAARSLRPVRPSGLRPAVPPARPKSVPQVRSPKQAPEPAGQAWVVWVGMAAMAGVGLRFVHLPDFMLPVAVGVGVAVAVALALRLLSSAPEAPAGDRPAEPPRPSGVVKPSPSRAVPRKDPVDRLSSLTRRPPSNPLTDRGSRG